MPEKRFSDKLQEYADQGDIQLKLINGEKIHGTIFEIGTDYLVLEKGIEKRIVNLKNVIFISPAVL